VEINASHLNPATAGEVLAEVRPVKIGKKVQVWDIKISQDQRLICQSRLTTMTVKLRM
jgi:1,4-dihydroxy-2-naphthoyl-CoA hydrolase